MDDELTARQRAISLRLGGRTVQHICLAVGRTEAWFHKWWGRYLQAGPEGLYDRTRANHHLAQRISPELERTILSIRRRLQAHAQVQFDNARELAGWGPAARTLSRVIQLCLRFGVNPVFIPAGKPQCNGSVENFNGWFQDLAPAAAAAAWQAVRLP
jgi:hypothetical protein